jgi:pimeloyl-ACP methyl ester carboxylesterase
MGGMSMMAFAEQFPEVVSERVVGVAFLATSSGGVGQLLPGAPGRLLDRAQPLVVAALARLPWVFETGRRTTAFALTKQLAFGGEVPDSYVVFVDQMIAKTPSDVIWDFFPSIRRHRRDGALAAYAGLPGLVVAGELDHVLPASHSEEIARALPRARLLSLEGTGHMSMLERHAEVEEAIEELLDEVDADRRAMS